MTNTATSHTGENKAHAASTQSRIPLFLPFCQLPGPAGDVPDRIPAACARTSPGCQHEFQLGMSNVPDNPTGSALQNQPAWQGVFFKWMTT